jgi:hypothetical protein
MSAAEPNETQELYDELKYAGFRFRIDDRNRLLVLPDSALTPAYRLAIKRHRDGLVALADLHRPSFRSIKRTENSMQRPDSQLSLFVERDPRADKQPPSSS